MEDLKKALVDFERTLELLPDSVANGLKVVKPEDLPGGALYHISTNRNIKRFVPCISKRTMDGEDRSVPRICVAPTIVVCMLGYGAVYTDFHGWDNKNDKAVNKAIWQIYDIPFKFAIRPVKKLLPDQKDTDEHWLIAYNRETREYIPRKVGLVQMVGYRSGYLKGALVDELTLIAKVDAGEKVYFNNDLVLEAGTWLLKIGNWRFCNRNTDLSVSIEPIDAKTHSSYAKGEISMESKPIWADW